MQTLLNVTVDKKYINCLANGLEMVCQFCYNDKTDEEVFINLDKMVEHDITSIIGILTFIESKGYNVNYIRDLKILIKAYGEAMQDLIANFNLSEYTKVYSIAKKL